MAHSTSAVVHGIRANHAQFIQQLLQVFYVGLTLGSLRTVVPALAEQEFGVPRGSFVLLATFVIAFGIVKGVLNFAAGAWSERVGRRRVLLAGWIAALPIPFLLLYARSWWWIVAATILLGINQGLTWSMTQTSKLDLAGAQQRGFAIGLNEFSGYIGVAVAGIVTGYLAQRYGARHGLFIFAASVVSIALLSTAIWIRETLHWARAEKANTAAASAGNIALSTRAVFALVTWRDTRLAAFNQAGLVEKLIDVVVWVFLPPFLFGAGLTLSQVGWVLSAYGFSWGLLQLWTGRWSDRIGRRRPIVAGMWVCAAGVALLLLGDGVAWWTMSATVMGVGMALLYPNLSAAISDLSQPRWRGTAIGVYRFWRDFGYAVGAAILALVAHLAGTPRAAFLFTAVAMSISGWWVWRFGKIGTASADAGTP